MPRSRGLQWRTPWRAVIGYGAVIALGTLALNWLDYRTMARLHSRDVYMALVAVGFLALGGVLGFRLGRPLAQSGGRNDAAIAALGITERELAVLKEIAAGRSTAQIADRLCISPHTVKTHVARLFEKLGARRRTDAVARARDLGLLS